MKKLILIVLSVFMIAAASITAACTQPDPVVDLESVSIKSERITGGNMYCVIGAVHKMEIAAKPLDATYEVSDITWTSSDATVVKVDADGNIQGRKVGNATVTLTVKGKTDTVTVNVKAGMMIPFMSSASTTNAATIPDKAFDRIMTTFWKSDSSQSVIAQGEEYIQAEYQQKREVEKIALLFHGDTYKPANIKLYGANKADFSDGQMLKQITFGSSGKTFLPSGSSSDEADSAAQKTWIELEETANCQYYRLVFPRTTTTQNIVLIEVEIYAPAVMTK